MRSSKRVSAALAFGLLAFQLYIPWSVPHFVTEDGPSHLYTASVARGLLFHHNSEYAKVYAFNPRIVPNWGTTILFSLLESIAGVDRTETVAMNLAVLAGFFSFAYAFRAVAPNISPWTPFINFLLESWFLWLGFYNFYLGMAAMPFVLGYYIRHCRELTIRRAIVLSSGILCLFFIHLIPAVLAMFAIALIGAWVNLLLPAVSPKSAPALKNGIRSMILVALASLPALILCLFFARGAGGQFGSGVSFLSAIAQFPMHAFVTSSGRAGNQALLVPVVLFAILLAIVTLTRRQWMAMEGALAIVTLATFLIYVFVPDIGLGGNEAKIRFAWGVFLLGGLLLWTSLSLRKFRIPFELCVSALLFANLTSTLGGVSRYSRAVEAYLQVADKLPHGSHFVRLGYPVPGVSERFQFQGIARDPLFHTDAYIAARCGCVDLSDYQAPSGIFPVVFAPNIPRGERFALWSFEGPTPDAGERLKWLQSTLPVPIDDVILVGDSSSPAGYAQLLSQLSQGMRLVANSANPVFVRLYEHSESRGESPDIATSGSFDDISPYVQYSGEWFHDAQFQEASGGTITYSDHPGDSFRMAFRGTAVTYLYTKAPNRGMADVLIDGHPVTRLDLYSADTRWQSNQMFTGLTNGQHTIEVRVAGVRNSKSLGNFVDLDQLIVR
jgi:hypothetical protein